MALTAPSTASTEVARAALRTLGRAGRHRRVSSLIGPGLRLVAAIIAMTIAPSATAVAWGYLTSEALLFATTAFMLWQLMPPADSSGFSNRRLLRFSLPMSLLRAPARTALERHRPNRSRALSAVALRRWRRRRPCALPGARGATRAARQGPP